MELWNIMFIFLTTFVYVKIVTASSPCPPEGYMEQYIQNEVTSQINKLNRDMLLMVQREVDRLVNKEVNSLKEELHDSYQGKISGFGTIVP